MIRKVFKKQELIIELQQIVNSNIDDTHQFQEYSFEQLNKQPALKSWSALQCLEHINRYDADYLPKIKKSLTSAEKEGNDQFKSGLMGYRFANFLHPDKNQLKTKTFPSMNPSNSGLSIEVIDTFIHQQKELHQLLERSKSADPNKIKIKSSITSLLSFKLGDIFRILVFHDLRHIRQAKNALKVN
jgi:hypothetical protein